MIDSMNGVIDALFEELLFLDRLTKKEGAQLGPHDNFLTELIDTKIAALES